MRRVEQLDYTTCASLHEQLGVCRVLFLFCRSVVFVVVICILLSILYVDCCDGAVHQNLSF